jgi:hypothetical protein
MGKMKQQCEELEQAYFELSTRYQSEVGEPRRLALQAREYLTKFDWESINEPPELREVLALVNQIANRFDQNLSS